MNVVALTSSPFFGGPERQMLGLALSLPADYRSVFLVFSEGGRCRPLLDQVRGHGLEGVELMHNVPHYRRAISEVAAHLRRLRADVLCCHGYKADLLGWRAARQAGVAVVSVSHGWTGATSKVRLNEALDRLCLRWLDGVVCVSQGQAAKVLKAGVPQERVTVIRNAIQLDPFVPPDEPDREILREFFPHGCERLVGAAGRLSPEKGFGQLVEAAALVTRADPGVGFILFGDGPLRETLTAQIAARGLEGRFVLGGFRTDLERLLPALDVVALPSFTEGLPVIVLEAFAAGVPVVATAVGGTPEVIVEEENGYLVPAGQPEAMARRLLDILQNKTLAQAMGKRGRQRVESYFTFEAQSSQYQRLFESLIGSRHCGSREGLAQDLGHLQPLSKTSASQG